MKLKDLNNLPFHEQWEIIEFGKIVPKLKDYPIKDSIIIDYNRVNDFATNVFGVETGLYIYLTAHDAKELTKDNPNKLFNFRKIGEGLDCFENINN